MKKEPILRIIVTVGAYPDVGKGIFTSSLGYLLQESSFDVLPLKFDGYMNSSSGAMNTYHGNMASKYSEEEVFVLKDGYEGDADSGYYERFLHSSFEHTSNITNGKVFTEILDLEKKQLLRQGEVINYRYIRNYFIDQILSEAAKCSILLLEIGGTVGDKEAEIMFDCLTLIKNRQKAEVYTILLSPYLPQNSESGLELSYRSKITRQAYEKSWRLGLLPNAIVMRTQSASDLISNDLEYIALESGLELEDIFVDPNSASIYELPQLLSNQKLQERVCSYFHLTPKLDSSTHRLETYANKIQEAEGKKQCTVAVFGKSVSNDTFVSLKEGIQHAAIFCDLSIKLIWLDDSTQYLEDLKHADVLIVGEGLEKIEEKMASLQYMREKKKPVLAFSFGMDLLLKEYMEHRQKQAVVVCEIEDGEGLRIEKGQLQKGTLAITIEGHSAYIPTEFEERVRCFSSVSADLLSKLKESKLSITAYSHEMTQPAVVELSDHPFYVGVRFHPEFISHPGFPHPLFAALFNAYGA